MFNELQRCWFEDLDVFELRDGSFLVVSESPVIANNTSIAHALHATLSEDTDIIPSLHFMSKETFNQFMLLDVVEVDSVTKGFS